jgi:hypothetical protein
VVAVLALYRVNVDAFNRDELGVLQALGTKLGVAVEAALKRSGGEVALGARAGGD